MRRTLVIGVTLVVAVSVAVIYYMFDPSDSNMWFPRCTLYTLTGIRCPGCGLQRAAHSLFHGDVTGALHYNALLPVLVVGLVLLAVGELVAPPQSRLARIVRHPVTAIIALTVLLAWTVARNLLDV